MINFFGKKVKSLSKPKPHLIRLTLINVADYKIDDIVNKIRNIPAESVFYSSNGLDTVTFQIEASSPLSVLSSFYGYLYDGYFDPSALEKVHNNYCEFISVDVVSPSTISSASNAQKVRPQTPPVQVR